MKSHLWKVTYNTRFSSSSGMTPYHTDETGLVAYVSTELDGIGSARRALENSLNNQTEITKITEAIYLGEVIS